ncbi:protoglobin domain-containing protein [Nisaea sp.]|uniref:protoglobin domain-containing protein n=1 Tax=Nisaea sp. TaxID=2024842 RepID=UPI0032976B22
MAEQTEISRLAFTEIDQGELLALKKIWPLLEKGLPSILDQFYRHIAADPDIAIKLEQGPGPDILKQAQIRFWQSLINDGFNDDYLARSREIGELHAGIGLGPRWHIGAAAFIQPRLFNLIASKHRRADDAMRYCSALAKAIALDMDLAQDAAGSSDETEKLKQQVLNLADTLEREIDQTVEEVMLQAGRVAELTNSLAAAATEMATLINEVRGATDITAGNVNSVAAATEQLSASSQEIAAQVSDSARLTGEATDSAEGARERVSALEEATKNISSVVGLINSIAAQTKLLALNATIEAARAGEAGRGFAVVASEVKSLAQQTENAIQEVSQHTDGVQTATRSSVEAITGIASKISEVNGISSGVASAVEEQLAATGEIGRSSNEASEMTGQVAASIAKVAEHAERTSQSATAIETLARNVSTNVSDMKRRLGIVVRAGEDTNRRGTERTPTVINGTIQFGPINAEGFIADLSPRGALLLCDGQEAVEPATLGGVTLANGVRIPARVVAATSLGIHAAFENIDAMAAEMVGAMIEQAMGENDVFRDICITAANEAENALASAISSGRISIEDMFDSQYAMMPGTNPAQYSTRFVDLTDALLTPIQEHHKDRDDRIRLLCATDRNGYIGTHNAAVSQPQRPDDPVWNAANCRNRRIFDDRAGLLAAGNKEPHQLQTYLRDMGGGNKVLLKEIDAPITLSGRHWGNMRCAFVP